MHRGTPGPRDRPTGPEAVRRAVLDAAAREFGRAGVDAVSLRDVARAADVHLGLIDRYVGSRRELVRAVFDDLGEQLVRAIDADPLAQQGFDRETTMGEWTMVLLHLVLAGEDPLAGRPANPVAAISRIAEAHGGDPEQARLRAAQVMASALGWRLFEPYLVRATSLEEVPVELLRGGLVDTHVFLSTTPWPEHWTLAPDPVIATSPWGGPGREPEPPVERPRPTGPSEVRRAVLDAAAEQFGRFGVDAVSLRDIAGAAGVQLALISRYLGSRRELVLAVLDDLTRQLAEQLADRPLEQLGYDPGGVMDRWLRVFVHLVIVDEDLAGARSFNPVAVLADVLRDAFRTDDLSARVRAAQVVAVALGWRLFEGYLVPAAGLSDVPIADLRDDLTASLRRIGAWPWEDPRPSSA